MEEYKSPVYNVIAVPVEKVVANTYNPNIDIFNILNETFSIYFVYDFDLLATFRP